MKIDPRILERRRKVGSELKPGYEDRKDDLRWEMKHERLRLASPNGASHPPTDGKP